MTRPVRILELRSVWGIGGGPDKTILNGAARTDRSRFEVTVCYIRDQRDTVFNLDRRARELGLDYAEVLEQHSLDIRVWPQLKSLVKTRGIDIVHAHDHKTDALTWALWTRLGVTPLSTAHGFSGYTRREQVYYAIEKRLLARFPRVIAVSQPIRDELVRKGCKKERITVINNGIDHLVFRRNEAARLPKRREIGLTDDRIAIGAVGRLEYEKRFDVLIDAFAGLKSRWPNAVLLIAGEGSLRPRLLEQITARGVGESVRLLGQSDVITLHAALDLFVQSSETEGTPNAVLEAMALETPVVATDVGGTRELITDQMHGLLVPRNDVAALQYAMNAQLNDMRRARDWATSARRRIETALSFAERMRKVEEIYDELARRKP